MIEIPLRRFSVCFRFDFFAAVAVIMLCGGNSWTILGFCACILHEFGHIAAMIYFGQPVKKIVFYAAGILIVRGENELLIPTKENIIILLSGCAVNFLIYGISSGLYTMYEFGLINLIIGLFNMLPLSMLDGGKIISAAAHGLLNEYAAQVFDKSLNAANAVLAISAAAVFYFAGAGNFTVYLTLLYLLAASVI